MRLSKKCWNFFKCHGRGCTDAKWRNLNWTSCFTFGRFTQPSKVLHSDRKFIQSNMWTSSPMSSFSFSIFSFPISLSSIYKSFPSNLCSLFSSRRSLVIWFNYNCSTRQIFGKHTQINQANTDTLQLDQQKRPKLEQK